MAAHRQNKALVSVIIPMHNTGISCLKLIKALKKSSYRNLEIICIDDGSTDDSFRAIARYAAKQTNIIVKHQKNAGPAAARNAGLKLATGKYLTFVDSDDIADRTFVEKLVEAFNDETILVCTAIQYRRVASGAVQPVFMRILREQKAQESFREYILYMLLQDGRLYGVTNKIFRRDIVMERGLRFDVTMDFAEDTKFVLDYLNACEDYYINSGIIHTICEALYTYNYGTATSIVSKSSLSWPKWRNSYRNLCAWTKKKMTLLARWRLGQIWCHWRLSHALAVARANLSFGQKLKYLNLIELCLATLLLKVRH